MTTPPKKPVIAGEDSLPKPENERTTAGKTGEELEEAVLDQQALQADLDDATLPTGTEIDFIDQEVVDTAGESELLSREDLVYTDIDTPTDVEIREQEDPEEFDAAEYDASVIADDIGEAEAAQGTVTQEMEAAQGTVSPDSLAEAATQELDPRATTQYQLGQLMASLKKGQPLPPWASPAVRKVTAIMQQRGLGSSSMAAAATMQAMMESGIAIASQDAQKFATIQLQNLNNEQQAALQNAATFAAMDMANLNNRQQAAVQNAKAFLSIDLQNLTNEQQANTLTYQSKVSALLSDQAAENAAAQFNAKSENEIKTFFAELGANIETANLNRATAVDQYNTSQSVAIDQFNKQMNQQNEQFNQNMQLEIDQSNAVWRRTINTQNTANQNEENRQNAMNLLGIQQNALNNLWQLYRDKAAWAMKISENEADRAHNAAMQAASFSESASLYKDEFENFLMVGIIDNIFGGGSSTNK